MSDLIAFLRARLQEDEDEVERARTLVAVDPRLRDVYPGDDEGSKIEAFIFDHDFGTTVIGIPPARVLAEVQAKRAILDLHTPGGAQPPDYPNPIYCETCHQGFEYFGPTFNEWPCPTIKALALPYADHPDYQEAWRP